MSLNKIILGTVQLGMDYGINNSDGKPSLEESLSILEKAYDSSIKMLDTAGAYGESQQIIGEFHKKFPQKKFDILSKFKKSEREISDEFQRTIDELQVDHLECYSLHSFSDGLNPLSVNALRKLKDQGRIKSIGISVYSNEELHLAGKMPEIDIIQIPFNLLDNKNKRGSVLKEVKDQGKMIHARSVFLQGLFYKDIDSFPLYLNELKPFVSELHRLSHYYNIPMNVMALSYVGLQEEIDKVLIGTESVAQLESNIKDANHVLPNELVEKINLLDAPEVLLDPRNWK